MSSGQTSLWYGNLGNRRERSPRHFYLQRKRRREQQKGLWSPTEVRLPRVDEIADTDYLLDIFDDLKRFGGQAPGPDGITYADLSRREAAANLRGYGNSIREGAYRPGPSRKVPIPKPSGGHRILNIRGVCDRVISTGLNRAMSPFWETVFLPQSHGFRAGRSPRTLLAELEHRAIEQNRWVLAIDDVRKAFDNLDIADVVADHRRYIGDTQLMGLIESVLRGHQGLERRIGIDQGSAYSPIALNVRLHHTHDLVLSQDRNFPSWLRYADNLTFLCQDVSEGRQILKLVNDLLARAGFQLKFFNSGTDDPIVDLKRGSAQLLGFKLSFHMGQLVLDLGEDAWDQLLLHLTEVHKTVDPARMAQSIIRSWISAYGPAFASERRNTAQQVLRVAARVGFRETLSVDSLQRQLRSSWLAWRRLRKAVHSSLANLSLSPPVGCGGGSASHQRPGDPARGPGCETLLQFLARHASRRRKTEFGSS